MAPAVKICGLMRAEDVAACCRLGAAICGFVTEYPLRVPWNLTRRQCAALLPQVRPPAKSCIVTGGEREEICRLALALQPDLVQLHFRETLEDTRFLVRRLAPHGVGVIKTIPTSADERLRQFGTADPRRCAEALSEAGVYAVLVDARQPENAAQGGGAADLSLFRAVQQGTGCPVMLAGGITPENCREIVARARPHMIDVMTGVELSPGVKSPERLERLFTRMRETT